MVKPTFKPGDPVLYHADACHQLDVDRQRQPLFAFEHVVGVPGNRKRAAVRKGDVVDFAQPMTIIGRNDASHFITQEGHVIKATAARFFWAGKVAAFLPHADRDGKPIPVAVDADGNVVPDDEGRILIDVPHPMETHTLHYAVRYSAAKAPHTFHRQGD